MTIGMEALDGKECYRTLSPPEPYIVDVGAVIEDDRLPDRLPDLCRIADDAANAAASLLNSGKPLPVRTFPQKSLATLDACALLDMPALRRVGMDSSSPVPRFGNWDCQWEADSGRFVKLRFDQHPHLSSPDDGSPTSVGWRTAFIEHDGDGGGNNCVARIEYRPFLYGGGQKTELVHLVVRDEESPDTLCALAKSLAATVATKLPPN